MKLKRVVSPEAAFLMTHLLQGVFKRGTAAGVAGRINVPVAGKTGTTNDYRDAWFVGYTPQLVTAVWVGFDDNRSMRNKNRRGITGGRAALPIWTAFMNAALRGEPDHDFNIPSGIIFENVDPRTGRIVRFSELQSMRVALRYGTKLAE